MSILSTAITKLAISVLDGSYYLKCKSSLKFSDCQQWHLMTYILPGIHHPTIQTALLWKFQHGPNSFHWSWSLAISYQATRITETITSAGERNRWLLPLPSPTSGTLLRHSQNHASQPRSPAKIHHHRRPNPSHPCRATPSTTLRQHKMQSELT
jgi:hypothetical protein